MLYIVLLHYPVYNKEGRIVTTAIANMDIHDIARLAKTYGVRGFYIVNPVTEQRNLAEEIISHWREGYGANYNKFRQAAFESIRIKESLEEVVANIVHKSGFTPKTIVTGANFKGDLLKFTELKEMLRNSNSPYLLIFGTGSGIAAEVANKVDYRLEPIKGHGNYNHLAVRSAVAIILDRVIGI
ncbi:MAG: RNA methyltransferase [Deltaproteobacteria bacterium]|nr:RNA methyltransferase [Deltaproteobacteria bacterium]